MRIHRHAIPLIAALALAALAGCSSPTGAAPSQKNSPPAASASPARPTSRAKGPPAGGAASTALDPCQLVTAPEASGLTGAVFGAGLEETTGTGPDMGRRCTYGANTSSVFFVQVGQGTDAASARAQWDDEVAKVEAAISSHFGGAAPGELTEISGLGDRAGVATLSESLGGVTLTGTSLFLLKGATFLAFGDVTNQGAAPTPAAMKAQALTSIARLP